MSHKRPCVPMWGMLQLAQAGGTRPHCNFRDIGSSEAMLGVILPRTFAHLPRCAIERLHKKVISPHHRLVHAQSLMQMVHAALENSLPLGIALRRMMRAQAGENAPRHFVVVRRSEEHTSELQSLRHLVC